MKLSTSSRMILTEDGSGGDLLVHLASAVLLESLRNKGCIPVRDLLMSCSATHFISSLVTVSFV